MKFSLITYISLLATAVSAIPAPDAEPLTYAALMEYDVVARHNLFQRASEDVKGEIRAQGFEAYQAAHPDLTAEQNNIINDAIAMARSGDHSNYQNVKAAAIQAFGFDETRTWLAGIAPDGTRITKAKRVVLGRQDLPYCECATGDNWCSGGLQCIKKSKTCNVLPNDCGWWEADDCNGLCYE